MKCKVIEWNENGRAVSSLDAGGQVADRDIIRTPLSSPVGEVFPEDSAHVYESAL